MISGLLVIGLYLRPKAEEKKILVIKYQRLYQGKMPREKKISKNVACKSRRNYRPTSLTDIDRFGNDL